MNRRLGGPSTTTSGSNNTVEGASILCIFSFLARFRGHLLARCETSCTSAVLFYPPLVGEADRVFRWSRFLPEAVLAARRPPTVRREISAGTRAYFSFRGSNVCFVV